MAGEWVTLTVGELVDDRVLERPIDGNHGELHPRGPDFVAEGVPFIMASDLVEGRVDTRHCAFIREKQANSLRKGFARSGDVLISHKATMGRTALVGDLEVPFLMLTPQVTYYRVLDTSRLDRRFLKFYFDSPGFQMLFETWGHKGSTRAYLGITAQLDLPVALPPIAEQHAIARILGVLDDKIELNRRMNETLEAIARALFKSWFVDFDPVRAKAEGRDPGLPTPLADLFPDSFDDSELGAIPKGWRVTTLGSVLQVLETGGRPQGGVSEIREGVPSVGAESIVGLGRFDYSKTKFVPRGFVATMKKGHVRDQDVLLYKDGGRPGEFEPHVTLVGDGFPFSGFVINEHVYRIRTAPALPQSYLYLWLSSDGAMEEMRVRGTGVAVPGLNSSAVRALPVILPSSRCLTAFDERVSSLIRRILAAANETRILAVLRNTLLPKLISGELRVKDLTRFLGGIVA